MVYKLPRLRKIEVFIAHVVWWLNFTLLLVFSGKYFFFPIFQILMTVGVEARSYKRRFAGLGHLKPGWISKVLNYFEIDKIQNLHQRDRRDGEWEQFLKAGPLLFLAIPFVYTSFYHFFHFLNFEKEKCRSLLLLISVSILTWLLTWQGTGRHFR